MTRAARVRSRRGTAYVFVLLSSLMLAVIAMGSVTIARNARAGVTAVRDAASAEILARATLERFVAAASGDADWFARHVDGTWSAWRSSLDGEVRVRGMKSGITEIAGAPLDGAAATLEAQARVGGATAYVRCVVAETRNPYNALRYGIACEGDLTVPLLSSLITTQEGEPRAAIHAGGDCGLGGTLLADLVLGGTLRKIAALPTHVGDLEEGADARDIPSSTAAEYAKVGTPVRFLGDLDRVVLAPGYNDYDPGVTDPDGVYVIDTGGSRITIRDSRIVGTLVILGGGIVSLEGRLSITPARLDRPSLLVEGPLVIDFEGYSLASEEQSLSEATFGRSFNPPDGRFDGSGDADLADAFPSRVEGLVHASGSVRLGWYSNVRGVLLSNKSVDVEGNVAFTADARVANWPPPLFGEVDPTRLRVVEGTFELVRE